MPLLGWPFSEASPHSLQNSPPSGHWQGREETPRLRDRERADGPSRARSPAGRTAPPGDLQAVGLGGSHGTQHRESTCVLAVGTLEREAGFFNPTANCYSIHWHLLSPECRRHGAPGEARGKGELVGVTLA